MPFRDMDPSAPQVEIPTTLREAEVSLNALDSLLTAKGWERAAIVYAFTHDDRIKSTSRRVSCGEFAARGIAGLTKRQTVQSYRDTWKAAMDAGAPEAKPGATLTLPTEEFPAMRTGTDGYESPAGAAQTIDKIVAKHGPEVVAAAAERNPSVARAVTRTGGGRRAMTSAIHDDAETAAAAASAVEDRQERQRGTRPRPSTPLPPVQTDAEEAAHQDADNAIYRLHNIVVQLGRIGREHPEVITNRVDDIVHEVELLGIIVDIGRGVNDADLAKLLDGVG